MSMFSETTNSVPALREANKLQFRAERDADRVRSAALVAVWLLIPFALGGAAYLLLGFFLLIRARFSTDASIFGETIPFWPWLILALLLQAAYWCWLSRPWQKGLWALIPLVGLVPTFVIARQVLLRGQAAGQMAPPSPHQPPV